MSKRTFKSLDEIPDDSIEKPDVDSITNRADAEELDQVHQILRDEELTGGTWRLERKGPTDVNYQYCSKFPASQPLDRDIIARTYGGGDYKVRTFRANGQMFKQAMFSIDYRIKGSLDTTTQMMPQESNVQIMKRMDDSNNNMMMMYDKINRSSNESSNNMMLMMMTMMQKSSEQMSMVMAEALKPKPSAVETYMPLMIEMIRRPSEGGGMKLTEMINAVKELQGIPIVKPEEQEDAPEKKDTFGKIIDLVGPLAAAFMASKGVNMQQAMQTVQPTQPSAIPESSHEPVNNAYMVQYVPHILNVHKQGKSPKQFVDLLSMLMAEDQKDLLLEMLEKDDWFQTLFNNDLQIANIMPWMLEVRKIMIGAEQPMEQMSAPKFI